MVIEFKVGDLLEICASVHEFCGTYGQLYSLDNINIAKFPDACTVFIDSCIGAGSCCLPLSGLQVEFRFTNYTSPTLKTLGTYSTNSNGSAAISYTLTEEDAALFNNNPGFRVMAYLVGSGPNYPPPTAGSRYKTASNLLIRGPYIGNGCILKGEGAICLGDKTLIVYENPTYTAGQITDACVYRSGGSQELPDGKIKVFRLTGTIWTLVGESGFLPIQNGGITTFTGLNIIVQKGDYIGLYIRPSPIYGFQACIDASGGVGLFYTKTHLGDVLGTTDNSEWTSLDNYRVSISATILPCVGVTCTDICVGYDLYSQICDTSQGCIQNILIEPNSPSCGYISPGQEKHYIYFQVSTLFPANYIIDKLSYVYTAATNAILDYISDYYVEAIDFDQSTYILTVIITKRQILSGPAIRTMVGPLIIVVLGVIAIAIASAILVWLAMWPFGSKSLPATPSTRIIKVTPTTSATQIIPPTFPIVVEYNDDKTPKIIEITDGLPKTFSVATNIDTIVTVKAMNNPYYKITKRTVPKCSPVSTDPCANPCAPECEIVAVFAPTADATLNPGAVDSSNNPITCGFYEVYEQDSQGSLTLIKRQALGTDGKVDPTKVVADVNQCIYIVPCDLNTYRPQMKCYKTSAGQTETGNITVNTCLETKNQISVRTVYIAADGTRQPFTAERIDIKLGGTVVATKVPTSDLTLLSGLEKNTTYSVFVTKSGYNMTNNGLSVLFGNTDCDVKDAIMEANPPANSYDITIEVRSSATGMIIQGASVILDTRAPQTTGAAGTTIFTAIPTGNHHFKIIYTGYKDKEFDYNVTISETILRSLDIDQVYQNVDTRIADFAPSTVLYANSTIKFKGKLQFLEGTDWKSLMEATIDISLKKDSTEIKTFTAITSSNILWPGTFETTDWLIPTDYANSDISVHAEFTGASQYNGSIYDSTYHIGQECSIRNPISGECMLSPGTGLGIMIIAGLGLVAAIMFLRPGGGVEIIRERLPSPTAQSKTLPSSKEGIA